MGCTGSGTKEQFGIDGPIRGTLFDTEQLKNGTSLSLENFCRLSIEGEMAIKIDADGCINSVFPVIELHNFIFRPDIRLLFTSTCCFEKRFLASFS